ncbi:SGT1-ecdysoneless-like protein [Ceratobasidium sp. AG-Ba]|nr:SGT1-ecdysoneless-like protein [Ceratobasidium sp. AG-Ba]
MSMNDIDLNPAQGADVYSGVANPTAASVANDPRRDNFARAGAGPTFDGGKDAERALKPAAGVVESKPGLIESTNIPPLSQEEEPGFNAPSDSTKSTGGIGSTISGGAKLAYGTVTGDQATLEQGKQEYYGRD